jgi:hypothetical protein
MIGTPMSEIRAALGEPDFTDLPNSHGPRFAVTFRYVLGPLLSGELRGSGRPVLSLVFEANAVTDAQCNYVR